MLKKFFDPYMVAGIITATLIIGMACLAHRPMNPVLTTFHGQDVFADYHPDGSAMYYYANKRTTWNGKSWMKLGGFIVHLPANEVAKLGCSC